MSTHSPALAPATAASSRASRVRIPVGSPRIAAAGTHVAAAHASPAQPAPAAVAAPSQLERSVSTSSSSGGGADILCTPPTPASLLSSSKGSGSGSGGKHSARSAGSGGAHNSDAELLLELTPPELAAAATKAAAQTMPSEQYADIVTAELRPTGSSPAAAPPPSSPPHAVAPAEPLSPAAVSSAPTAVDADAKSFTVLPVAPAAPVGQVSDESMEDEEQGDIDEDDDDVQMIERSQAAPVHHEAPAPVSPPQPTYDEAAAAADGGADGGGGESLGVCFCGNTEACEFDLVCSRSTLPGNECFCTHQACLRGVVHTAKTPEEESSMPPIAGWIEDVSIFLCRACVQAGVELDPNDFIRIYASDVGAAYNPREGTAAERSSMDSLLYGAPLRKALVLRMGGELQLRLDGPMCLFFDAAEAHHISLQPRVKRIRQPVTEAGAFLAGLVSGQRRKAPPAVSASVPPTPAAPARATSVIAEPAAAAAAAPALPPPPPPRPSMPPPPKRRRTMPQAAAIASPAKAPSEAASAVEALHPSTSSALPSIQQRVHGGVSSFWCRCDCATRCQALHAHRLGSEVNMSEDAASPYALLLDVLATEIEKMESESKESMPSQPAVTSLPTSSSASTDHTAVLELRSLLSALIPGLHSLLQSCSVSSATLRRMPLPLMRTLLAQAAHAHSPETSALLAQHMPVSASAAQWSLLASRLPLAASMLARVPAASAAAAVRA